MKEIIDRLNFIKIKTVCFVKAVKTKTRQATNLEKYLEKIYPVKGCYPKYTNSTRRKLTTQLKNGQRIWTSNSPKKIHSFGTIYRFGKTSWRRDRLPTPVFLGFPCGSAGKESTCNAGDLGSISVLGRYPEKGKATHSSILAWRIPWTIVHGVAKSQTQLSDFQFSLSSLWKDVQHYITCN